MKLLVLYTLFVLRVKGSEWTSSGCCYLVGVLSWIPFGLPNNTSSDLSWFVVVMMGVKYKTCVAWHNSLPIPCLFFMFFLVCVSCATSGSCYVVLPHPGSIGRRADWPILSHITKSHAYPLNSTSMNSQIDPPHMHLSHARNPRHTSQN